MDLCSDGFVQDARFENRIGYESQLYPGVIFQKHQSDLNIIAKIHLTEGFKGYLPDGNYIDMKSLKAIEILKNMIIYRLGFPVDVRIIGELIKVRKFTLCEN